MELCMDLRRDVLGSHALIVWGATNQPARLCACMWKREREREKERMREWKVLSGLMNAAAVKLCEVCYSITWGVSVSIPSSLSVSQVQSESFVREIEVNFHLYRPQSHPSPPLSFCLSSLLVVGAVISQNFGSHVKGTGPSSDSAVVEGGRALR